MDDERGIPQSHNETHIGRRGFLGVAGAGLLGAAAYGLQPTSAWAAPAAPVPGPPAPETGKTLLRFAVVTDTHLNADIPTRASNMKATYEWIASQKPDLVLNCGDITDYGSDDEFAAYLGTIPAS